MKLSAKGRYAVRAMLFLAEKEQAGPQPLGVITGAGLPRDYVEQLLGTLRRRGLILAARGPQGGYFLARPASDISLGEVIEAVEGPLLLCECAMDEHQCRKSGECAIRDSWVGLTNGIDDLMRNYTLRDMLKGHTHLTQGEKSLL